MEQRYKMAVEAIKTLIEYDEYPDKKVIKAICDTALNVRKEDTTAQEE